MQKVFLAIFIFISNFCYSQNKIDSATISNDTRPVNEKSEYRHSVRPYILPAVFIAYGFASLGHNTLHTLNTTTKNELNEDHSGFHTKVDNYLQYSPAVAVYALSALGVKGKNNFRDRTVIYAITTLFSTAMVVPLKKITKEQRPDGSGFNSFPSGHTTTAFAAAVFLQHEYKDISPWYGIAGYAAATATGILRLYNKKHFVGDIVAGAGFGILSTKLAYAVYPFVKKKLFKNKISNAAFVPYYQQGGGGLAMIYNFNK
ncbi:MAG: phosphatase PAP2 family protein [Ferruginibacter sp.]